MQKDPGLLSAAAFGIALSLFACVLDAFFSSALLRSSYDGALDDDPHGIAKIGRLDRNTINSGLSLALLVVGRVLAG